MLMIFSINVNDIFICEIVFKSVVFVIFDYCGPIQLDFHQNTKVNTFWIDIFVITVYSLHMYYMVDYSAVIHIFYTCNTHKTPHMYYRNGMYKEGWRGIKSNDASQGAMV